MATRTLSVQELEARFGERSVVTVNSQTFLVKTKEVSDGKVRVFARPHPKQVCRELPFSQATWPLVRFLKRGQVTETVTRVGLSGLVEALIEEHLRRAEAVEPEPEPWETDVTTLPDEVLLAEVRRRGLWPSGADEGGEHEEPEVQ